MAENSEFENFKAARAANDEAGAVAAIAEVDAAKQIPPEPEGNDRGENEIEKELRERADAAKPKSEEEEPEQTLEEKQEEKPEEKHGKDPKRRIAALTKEKYEARTEAEQPRKEAAELRARIEALEKRPVESKPPDRQSTPQEVKAAGRQEHVAELRLMDRDYDNVVKTVETLPQTVRDAVKEVGNPARVEYFLAKFPDARKDLEGRAPETQRAIIRDISESLDTFHNTYKNTASTPRVEQARSIERAALQLENASDIQFLLEKDPSVGAHLMALPADKAIATVKEIGANLKAGNFPTVRAVAEAIKDEGENGDKVFAHFQAHPEEFEAIAKMPPIKAAREVARLAATLEAPREKSRSRVPEPIKPLSSSPSRSELEPREDMSLADWKKYRENGGGR